MTYLVAAVGLAVALTVFNLLLTLGVLRRLREHTALFAQLGKQGGGDAMTVLPIGSKMGAFEATTTDGTPVSNRDVTAGRLVGFFLEGCEPCLAELPSFVHTARHKESRPLAVVVTLNGNAAPAELTEPLRGVADVVVEDRQGPVVTAFKVGGFPATCVVDDDGVIGRATLDTHAPVGASSR